MPNIFLQIDGECTMFLLAAMFDALGKHQSFGKINFLSYSPDHEFVDKALSK